MNAPGALAITGVLLFFASLCCAVLADDMPYRSDRRRRVVLIAWVLFAVAIASGIGASWWEALS